VEIALHILAVVCIATLCTLGLVMLARVTHKRHHMHGTDDVETAYIAALSTLYGIFIAFMIFTVWIKYNDARNGVAAEANTIAEAYRLSGGLPQPMRAHMEGLLLDYSRSIIDHEWNSLRRGELSADTERVVSRIWRELNRMGPDNVKDDVLRDHLLTAWSKITDIRRLRLLWSSTGLNEYAYALLVVGGLIALAIACLFTVDDFGTHALKACALGSMIALMLVAIWGLDHPFQSRVRLPSTPYARVQQLLSSPKTIEAPAK
jgi:hypothetical protein